MDINKNNLNFSESIEELIHTIAKNNDFKNYKVLVKELNNKGISFLCKTYKITYKNNDDNDELKTFMKIALTDDILRKQMGGGTVYCRENMVYNKIAKKFDKLQEDYNVPDSERFRFAKHYGTLDKNLQETLILEDLEHKGYKVLDKFEVIDFDYGKAVMESLAKFHALSMVMKTYTPDEFKTDIASIENVMLNKSEEQLNSDIENLQKLNEKAFACLKDPQHIEKFKKFMDNHDFTKIFLPVKHSTLCHGDLKVSNVFIRTDKENRINETILIDYQLIYFGNPINDIHFFLFANVDENYRKNYYHATIEAYYEAFNKFLSHFNIDSNDVYKKDDFLNDVKNNLGDALFFSLIALPLICMESEDVPDVLDWSDSSVLSSVHSKYYIKRINAVVEDCIQYGVL